MTDPIVKCLEPGDTCGVLNREMSKYFTVWFSMKQVCVYEQFAPKRYRYSGISETTIAPDSNYSILVWVGSLKHFKFIQRNQHT